MNLRKGSAQIELDQFFQHQYPGYGKHIQHITKSAFFQARQQLSQDAFVSLNHQAMQTFYRQAKGLKTWKGFRLCAVDGSKIRLPHTPGVIGQFGVHSGKKGNATTAMGLASVYFDVLNRLVIDARLTCGKGSEYDCALGHGRHAGANGLVLYDRNYNAFWFYALHCAQQRSFCIRGKVDSSPQLSAFVGSGKKDAIITMKPSAQARRRCQQRDVPTKPLQLRLIRVELDNEIEVLVTNLLDADVYKTREFKNLYHLRWGVEELYKRLKQWVEIENFSGKSALSVQQDFHAHILATNITGLAVLAAQHRVDKQTVRRRYQYQVNFAQALSKIKQVMVALFKRGCRKQKTWLTGIVKYLAKSIEPIRDDRCYPRNIPSQKNRRHFMCYKRAQ